jgi:2,4-diketo-3-deoxy-L-fuconate hydrolase
VREHLSPEINMTFRFANVAGRAALVDAAEQWYDLERLTNGAMSSDPMVAVANGAGLHDASETLAEATPDGALSDADLGSPVPVPRNAFGIGLNYQNHAAESNMEVPEKPLVFTKFTSCIVGPNAEVELRTKTGDYEAELVVVIGEGGRDISEEDAWDHVLGLTAGQDVSDRALQFAAKPPHFDLGKSRDTYGPMGPVLVSTDSFADPKDLVITCDINGDRRQDDRTSNLIFTVAQLISYLSGIITLVPGDVIFTGTPEGVGGATRTYLNPGDEIVTTIEGIGTMRNVCIA